MNTAARYVWLLLVTWACPVFGQVDSVRLLPEFVIQQSRLDEYMHQGFEVEPDSTTLRMYEGNSLAQLLKSQGLALIRSYSPGGLATASIRGAGSSHTAVLWHGINIESPMNAQVDLEQLPVGIFNQIYVQSGGNSTAYGSGSVGGTIQLNQQAKFRQGWQARITGQAGSFSQLGTMASLRFSNANMDIGGVLALTHADNNFTYPSQITGDAATWENARQQLAAFNQHLNWQISPEHLLYTRIWYQNNSSEIPTPAGVLRPGSAEQEDEVIRALFGYLYTRNQFELRYHGSFLYHDMYYEDSLASLYSVNGSKSFIQQMEGTWKIAPASQWTNSVQYLHEMSETINYGELSTRRNRISLSSIYRFAPSLNWNLTAGFREALIDGEFTPLSPFINADALIRRNLWLNVAFSRNFRVPSFNDLYWQGAGGRGNPELKTETSLGGEAGLTWSPEHFSFTLTGYTQHVDDWIQWIPVQRQVWSPMNVKQVWLRGLESQASWQHRINEFNLKIQGMYRFTKATNTQIYSSDNLKNEDNQLMFTPMHSGSVILEGNWRTFTLLSSTAITGRQYSDADNSTYREMDAYVTTDIWAQKKWGLNSSILAVSGSINNLFNAVYEARPGYPMPGRNYMLRIIYEFNH